MIKYTFLVLSLGRRNIGRHGARHLLHLHNPQQPTAETGHGRSHAHQYLIENGICNRSLQLPAAGCNDNDNILFSVHLSQGMIINCTHAVHVHHANFAVIILMNLTNFNNILTSRLLNSLCISNIPTRHISQTCLYIIVFVPEKMLCI